MEKYILKVTISYNEKPENDKKEHERVNTLTHSICETSIDDAINEANHLIGELEEKFGFNFPKRFEVPSMKKGYETICSYVDYVIVGVSLTTLYFSDINAALEHAFKSQKEYEEWEKN